MVERMEKHRLYLQKVVDKDLQNFCKSAINLWHPYKMFRGKYSIVILGDDVGFPYIILMFSPANPLVVQKLVPNINPNKCLFLRRILTLPPWQGSELPSMALNPKTLFDFLPNISLIYSFVVEDHTGALYRHAGWKFSYMTQRGLQCVYILRPPRSEK